MNNLTAAPIYNVSFRCYFELGRYTKHRQDMTLKDIQYWIDAYQFTHPDCKNIVVKIWLKEKETAYEPSV